MSNYLQNVIEASGGYAAPEDNLKEEDIRESLKAAGILIPEEQDLADALLEVVEKHGKFNDDNTGVWAGYTSAKENAENAEIGVKCGNCIFWEAPNGCKVIVAQTEEDGLCRFAVLPDGSVTASAEVAQLEKDEDDPCWDGYVQVGMKDKDGKRVPNCVPSASAIDFLVDSFNSQFGASRQIKKEDAYAIARKACDKYSYVADEKLYSAILWDLHTFSEYATSGAIDVEQDFSEYSEYLPDGHPSLESSLTSSAAWVAGASELDNSGRDAILAAFSDSSDYVKSLHASTRVRAMISSGALTDTTLTYIKLLADRHSKVS